MANNNPFRKPSGNVQHDVEDGGKSKFKPKVFTRGNKNQLNSNTKNPFSKKYDDRKSIFYKNKEKIRFNEVAKGAKPENSTPWNKYKGEIIFRQRDESQAALHADMENEERKAILKQREISYRRSLAEQKKQEATKWEDFAEDYGQIDDSQTQRHKGNQSTQLQFYKAENLNSKSRTRFKKKHSNTNFRKDFISKDLLENFDSKKLSFEQNDKLRSVITKNTLLAKEKSLQNVVNDLKRRKERKKERETII